MVAATTRLIKATNQVLDEEACWIPGPIWKVIEKRKSHDLTGVRTPYRLARSDTVLHIKGKGHPVTYLFRHRGEAEV